MPFMTPIAPPARSGSKTARTVVGPFEGSRRSAITAAIGPRTAWDPNTDSFPDSVTASGSTVYVAGPFTQIGGQQRIT